MSSTVQPTIVSLEKAEHELRELIRGLTGGSEIVISQNDRPIARLVGIAPSSERTLGTMAGTVTYMSDDFDAPLEDFQEYS